MTNAVAPQGMFWRQTDVVTPTHLRFPITVIGLGGIGSPTAVLIAKMGAEQITVMDHDSVELHNLPSTFYRLEDIGKSKVDALTDICRAFTGIDLEGRAERFVAQPLSGLVIAGPDSMAARMAIWEKTKWNIAVPLYIEARMSAQVFMIHAVKPCDPSDVRWYETTMPRGQEEIAKVDAEAEPCTNRAVIYNTFTIASLIGNVVKRFGKGEKYPKKITFDFVNLGMTTQFDV